VSKGHVSEERSLSDHRYVVCQVGDLDITRVLPRVVQWVRYIQLAVNMVQQAILSPRLSSKGGPLTRDSSLVEQSIELVEALKPQQDGSSLVTI